jgi:hypothetical protein
MIYNIKHGGSGSGQSMWKRWASECLVKMDLESQYEGTRNCNLEWAAPLTLGTLFHAYMECWFKYEKLEFVDEICGELNAEITSEAYRIFRGWRAANRTLGKAIAVELFVPTEILSPLFGVSPLTAALDLLVEREDGIYVVDYKTTSKFMESDFDVWPNEKYYIQRVLYTAAAKAMGFDVQGFEYEAVAKTKEIKVRTIPGGLASLAEIEKVRQYLQYAQERRTNYPRHFEITQCRYCRFSREGICQGMQTNG